MYNMNFLNKKTQRKPIQKVAKVKVKVDEELMSSKFRMLNEKLYTISSEEAYDYFQSNPDDFDVVSKHS